MSRYVGPSCRLCRREATKLFLKGTKCLTEKCPVERRASRELVAIKLAQEAASRGQPVSWLSVDTDKAAGRMTERPTREAIPINAQEQLIVELYSK